MQKQKGRVEGQHTGICGLRTQRRSHHWPSDRDVWVQACNFWRPQCPSHSMNTVVHISKQRLSKPRNCHQFSPVVCFDVHYLFVCLLFFCFDKFCFAKVICCSCIADTKTIMQFHTEYRLEVSRSAQTMNAFSTLQKHRLYLAFKAPVAPRNSAKSLVISIISTFKSTSGRSRTVQHHKIEITVANKRLIIGAEP